VSAVNDVSADVVSVCGPPDTRSSGLQFIAADTTPRDGARQTGEHSNLLIYDTADRSREMTMMTTAMMMMTTTMRMTMMRMTTTMTMTTTTRMRMIVIITINWPVTADRSRASSPHLIICKHLDDNEDAGDEENDDSDCSGIGGPESSPHHRTLATVSANGMQYASSQRS